MNRGSGTVEASSELRNRTSMRPRFMNRGSCAPGADAATSRLDFNEAPIHESGKSPAGGRAEPLPCRTSMRPRFMNRGSKHEEWAKEQGLRYFNEAPIHESGKSRTGAEIARCSLSFNEAPIHESGKFDCADDDVRQLQSPSMRPRFMNRGRTFATASTTSQPSLQ